MLYLTPNNYVEINEIKYIINLNETRAFNQSLKKRIGVENFEINEVSNRRKRSLVLLNNKQAVLCNVNTKTLFERINNNEVKSMNNKFLDISYNNYIPINNILLIADYDTAPIQEIVSKLKERKSIKLFNFTGRRKTKTVIFTSTNEVILSAIESNTLYKRAFTELPVFQNVGHENYINIQHIHLIANRNINHIKLKVKAVENIDSRRVLKVSKADKPKSAIFCTNNFIVLSKNNPDTLKNNIKKLQDNIQTIDNNDNQS